MGDHRSFVNETRESGGKDVLGSHVEFHEGLDRSSIPAVLGGDGLRPEEFGLLTGTA